MLILANLVIQTNTICEWISTLILKWLRSLQQQFVFKHLFSSLSNSFCPSAQYLPVWGFIHDSYAKSMTFRLMVTCYAITFDDFLSERRFNPTLPSTIMFGSCLHDKTYCYTNQTPSLNVLPLICTCFTVLQGTSYIADPCQSHYIPYAIADGGDHGFTSNHFVIVSVHTYLVLAHWSHVMIYLLPW